MTARVPLRLLAAAAVLAGAPARAEAPAADPARRAAAEAIRAAQAAAAAFGDVTATLHKTEWKGGPLPYERIVLKLRNRPRAVYMRWVTGPRRGQEVIWREGWNGGKLRAHKGSFPDFSVNLAPTGWLAMRGSRHPVMHVGFDHILGALAHDFALADTNPECVGASRDLGVEDVHGAPARCFEFDTDKGRCPTMYAYRARFCMDRASGLPSAVKVWDLEDGEIRLVEDVSYAEIRVDAGLTDADFDPDRYDF
jgi:hypothetical protein